MRLLKVKVDGAELFKNCLFELDFIATDRVPRDDEGNISDVTPVCEKSSVYTENVIGMVGVNASGKTTALNIIRFILGYMSGPYLMRRFTPKDDKLGRMAPRLSISCVFYERGSFYLIESELALIDADSTGTVPIGERGFDSYAFANEQLWKYSSAQISRKTILDIDAFRDKSILLMRRNGPTNDPTVLDEAKRTFLGDDVSIVSIVTGKKTIQADSLKRTLPLMSLPTPIVQAFDPSVEYLNWNAENQVFHLKFKNESLERVVNPTVASYVLSNGTILGAELVNRAISALKSGGYLIVDEMETGLNRSLVGTVIGLFASPVTNPHGAVLLFSTHYPELLDGLKRKDNVYLLVRNESFDTEVVKYSDRIGRIENKKSDVVINNVIKGSMPRYPDVQAMRSYVCEHVNE